MCCMAFFSHNTEQPYAAGELELSLWYSQCNQRASGQSRVLSAEFPTVYWALDCRSSGATPHAAANETEAGRLCPLSIAQWPQSEPRLASLRPPRTTAGAERGHSSHVSGPSSTTSMDRDVYHHMIPCLRGCHISAQLRHCLALPTHHLPAQSPPSPSPPPPAAAMAAVVYTLRRTIVTPLGSQQEYAEITRLVSSLNYWRAVVPSPVDWDEFSPWSKQDDAGMNLVCLPFRLLYCAMYLIGFVCTPIISLFMLLFYPCFRAQPGGDVRQRRLQGGGAVPVRAAPVGHRRVPHAPELHPGRHRVPVAGGARGVARSPARAGRSPTH